MVTRPKSIIVTGGASGIGRATALALATEGWAVTIADRNEAGCTEIVAKIESQGGSAQWIKTDVTSEQDVRASVDYAVSTYGGLDAACNAAGVGTAEIPVTELSLEAWQQCIAINLTGPFLCVKHQIPAILSSGGGAIVIVASTASLVGFPNASEYCAAKAGVLGLVRGTSYEYAKRGVRINAILPGATKTPMLAQVMTDPVIHEALAGSHPIGRFAEPSEIASAILWLVSKDSSFVTGSAMVVDGGSTSI